MTVRTQRKKKFKKWAEEIGLHPDKGPVERLNEIVKETVGLALYINHPIRASRGKGWQDWCPENKTLSI